MTTLARGKVIAAKRPFSVVTRHATKRVWRRVMIEWLRRTHLKSLRDAGSQTMTLATTQSFILVVFRMTKSNSKRRRQFRCAYAPPQFMTNSA
jgi:hypothetical protein